MSTDFNPMGHHNPAEDDLALQQLAEACYADCSDPPTYRSPIAVEIGTWAGATALMLAKIGYRVFAIDHWRGNPDDRLGDLADALTPNQAFRTFCRNCQDWLYQRIFPLHGNSLLFAETWPQPAIDFLFIDASHEYQDVLADIQAWTPHVRPGSLIVGHDFDATFQGKPFGGVQKAVEETGPYERAGLTLWWRKKGRKE